MKLSAELLMRIKGGMMTRQAIKTMADAADALDAAERALTFAIQHHCTRSVDRTPESYELTAKQSGELMRETLALIQGSR